MKYSILLGAAATLSLLSACNIGGEEAPSAAAIDTALKNGNLGKAQRMIALAHDSGAQMDKIRILSAKVSLARGDGISAETSLISAKESGAPNTVILPLLAEAYARQNKYEDALKIAGESRNKAIAFHVAGLQHWNENKAWKAREALEKAYAITPENSRLGIDIVRARTELGLFPEAREAVAAITKSEPKNMLAPLALGEVEMRVKNYDAASRAFSTALELAPGSSDALLGKSRALYASGDIAEAKKAIIALPRDVAMHPEIQLLAAKIATKTDGHKNARTHFANAASVVEGDAEAQFLLAQLHLAEGQPYKAILLLENAVNTRPDLPAYHAALITAYLQTDDEQSAAARLAKVPASLKDAKELQGL